MYVRDLETRSCKPLLQCASTISITNSECVYVSLGIQHAMRMRHIVICGLPRCTIIFHIFHKWHDFRKKKLLNTKFVF